MQMSELKIGGS